MENTNNAHKTCSTNIATNKIASKSILYNSHYLASWALVEIKCEYIYRHLKD